MNTCPPSSFEHLKAELKLFRNVIVLLHVVTLRPQL